MVARRSPVLFPGVTGLLLWSTAVFSGITGRLLRSPAVFRQTQKDCAYDMSDALKDRKRAQGTTNDRDVLNTARDHMGTALISNTARGHTGP